MGRPAPTIDAGNSDSVRPIFNPLISNGNHNGHSMRVVRLANTRVLAVPAILILVSAAIAGVSVSGVGSACFS
jgi:hypothetical protein